MDANIQYLCSWNPFLSPEFANGKSIGKMHQGLNGLIYHIVALLQNVLINGASLQFHFRFFLIFSLTVFLGKSTALH